MDNPWKKYSKINPQSENGHRRIANSIYEALLLAHLTISELKTIMAIISRTWGWGKKFDAISAPQIASDTGITERSVWRAIRNVTRYGILISEPSDIVYRGKPINKYMVNKHFDTWFLHTERPVNNLTWLSCLNDKNLTEMVEKPDRDGSENLTGMSCTKEIKEKKESRIEYF